MKTIAELVLTQPELMRRHAILINTDYVNHIVKYLFKDKSSLELKITR